MRSSKLSKSQDPMEKEVWRRNFLASRAAAYRRTVPDGRPKGLFPGEAFMRSPGTFSKVAAPTPKALPAAPPAAVIALTRLAFGPRPGDIEAFAALGATDAQRLQVYIDQQLNPATIDDSAADARLAQAGFTTLGKSLAQLWQDHVVPDNLPWEEVMRPFYETVLATFLRAIHSRRQLVEVLAEFWHNHFSVYADDFPHGPVWVHSDRDAIRPNVLGNFRQMLEAVAKTPAMLYYLDNRVNSAEDPNENYAREFIELHCLGAENYLGSLPQNQVPRDGQGVPIGYVEEDVIAAASCLSGWTVSDQPWDPEIGDTGTFLYVDSWHDHNAKTILGVNLPANQPPMKDGQDLMDIVARHPGTGRFIARKLCRRLLGDFPPQSVVDAAAAVFTAHWQSPDQLARVVRTIVLAPQFLTTWADKVKRPFEIAVSGFRGAGFDLPFTYDHPSTGWFLWEYYHTGQPLFSWHPPNGYPDFKPAWNSTSPRVMCWRLVNTMVQIDDGTNPYFNALSATPPDVRSAQALVDFWSFRLLGRSPSPEEEAELVDFMAQGRNPTYDLPLATDPDTQERLRALVALLMMIPSFLFR